MILCIINHNFKYELEKLCRIFMPFSKITVQSTLSDRKPRAETIIEDFGGFVVLKANLYLNGKVSSKQIKLEKNVADFDKECERMLAVQLYDSFCEVTGVQSQWGILTGVRPAKLFGRLKTANGERYACEYFDKMLKVSKKKTDLCAFVSVSEENIISASTPNAFSLYISIPFCPSRCSYCSFVSHSVEQAGKLIPQYINLLCDEIVHTAKIAGQLNLKLMTVYFGGGTPTSLEAYQLEQIMSAVADNFDLSGVLEYTVEAGRPDTITKEKLTAIKQGGATRISINPQTLNDDVLKSIGRKHTSQQFFEAFEMARKAGFDNINTDIIAGLPGDTPQSFEQTLDKIINLKPESVTVHSLSMKRSSNMNTSGEVFDNFGMYAAQMVDSANVRLKDIGLLPYYMYRQSKTVGNLENTGYSLPGYEGLYNVYIMDETHTILSCGASAVTKLRRPYGTDIERVFNFKYPYEYISRFNEIIERKEIVKEFYEKYGIVY